MQKSYSSSVHIKALAGISVKNPAGDRVHYPTCEPCLGHGFQNYLGGSGDLNCGRDGAIAVLEPLAKAAITKSIGVTINGIAQTNLPTHLDFKALDVRETFVKMIVY